MQPQHQLKSNLFDESYKYALANRPTPNVTVRSQPLLCQPRMLWVVSDEVGSGKGRKVLV